MSDAVFLYERHTYSDISEFEVKLALLINTTVRVGSDDRVCLDNLLDLAVNKVVVRINMLLNKTS